MRYALLIPIIAIALLASPADADQTLLLRQPDVSADAVAFVYAGDIWIAERDGSAPRRLTTDPAEESEPHFSPDGSMIAFAGSYESNVDVYVIPVAGGQPRRLTWHPGIDIPLGWTPAGDAVALVSARETDHGRSGQLYHVSLDGGLPEKRMEARVFRGAYDARGERFAYIPFRLAYDALFGGAAGWKGYRGGTAPAIKVMDLEAQTVDTVPGGGASNFDPIWLDGRLYFLSDRDFELFNLFRYDPAVGSVERVSNETVWDIRSAAGHGSTIVYESAGRLKSLDVGSGAVTEIVVEIAPDLPQLRTRWKDVSGTIQSAAISPTGKRAIVTARGEVFTVPVDDGSTRNVSGTSDRREYTALWSPDGDLIAYIIDALKGQSLVIADQAGVESERFELGPHFYRLLVWGPGDTQRILFQDNHLSLFALTVDDGKIAKIATGTRREQIEAALTSDGRWLAYTHERPNFLRDLRLLDLASGETVTLTDGLADASAPAFSPDGRYLYFAASTNSGPVQAGLDMTSQERPYRAGLYAVVLAADGDSPLLPPSGDEEADEAEDEEAEEEEDADEVRVDLEGLASRIVALPVAERNYGNLGVGSDGNLYYVQAVQAGGTNEPPGSRAASGNALMRFDMEEKEVASLLTGVNGFDLSADGGHMLIRKVGGALAVAEVGADISPEPLDLGGLRLRIDPREEWALIFDEAWRMEREYFYDPDMHGLDWDAIHARYRPLVDHVGRREDLNALILEMIAEVQVGHNYAAGGDIHEEAGARTGLLGANLAVEDGRYRLKRVYTGETWNPFFDAPLATPGNEARAGEYLLAVNGRELTAADNIFEVLQGTSGAQTTLRVGPRPDGRDARDIVVEPVSSERMMRLWHWIESNRRRVDEASGGRVGYVYLPNTAGAGYTYFIRMFFAQIDKDAVIIDERSNAGGQAANYITDVLSRAHLSGWKDRDGLEYNTPMGALHGPKVMLIDQDAGSGGDYLPYSFRQLGIGKLIGTRTWGGLIGISANPQLVDGGALTVPFFRFYDASGAWSVENEGVAPDIEVELDPLATNRGLDSQLERAIAEVLSQLEDYESPVPMKAPAFPTEPGE